MKDIKDTSPNTELIDRLEKLLKEAKDGEIRSLIYVVGWNDSDSSHGWVIDSRSHRKPLIGAHAMLHHDLIDNTGLEFGESVLAHQFD